MLTNVSKLEHKIGDRVYQLFCDPMSPTSELKEALFEFVKFVGKVEDAVKEQQNQNSDEKIQGDSCDTCTEEANVVE